MDIGRGGDKEGERKREKRVSETYENRQKEGN